MKLQTKLRHVDIHFHWLWQKVQRQTIHIKWVPTKQMVADELTKALTVAIHEVFIDMIGIKIRQSSLQIGLLSSTTKTIEGTIPWLDFLTMFGTIWTVSIMYLLLLFLAY